MKFRSDRLLPQHAKSNKENELPARKHEYADSVLPMRAMLLMDRDDPTW
jgi:hypothetical protein